MSTELKVESLTAELDAEEQKLTLISKEDKKFVLERKNAEISNFIKTTLGLDITAQEIPLLGINSRTLEYIIEYLNYHKGVEKDVVERPLKSKNMKDACKDPWDADFIDKIGDVSKNSENKTNSHLN